MSKPKHKIKSGWLPGGDDHWVFKCSDGNHNSFWKTVLESPQWKAWQKEQKMRFSMIEQIDKKTGVYDMAEVEECGWLSAKHFAEFMEFAKDI